MKSSAKSQNYLLNHTRVSPHHCTKSYASAQTLIHTCPNDIHITNVWYDRCHWSSNDFTLKLYNLCCTDYRRSAPILLSTDAWQPPKLLNSHVRNVYVFGGWKPPLEQSPARPHLSSNTNFFSGTASKFISFSRSFPSQLFSVSSSVHRV